MDYCVHPNIRKSAAVILSGGVLAYPTESVWGLGADPFDAAAVEQILTLKGRSKDKGLILVASDISQFSSILKYLPFEQQQILNDSWPGPINWLVPHSNQVPSWISGQFDTVALRVSAHPVVKALCTLTGSAIVSTSANPQGLAPARYAYRARQYFGPAVEYCAGQVGSRARPCEIRDLNSGQIVRA